MSFSRLSFSAVLSTLLIGCSSGPDYTEQQRLFIFANSKAIESYADASNDLQYKEIWERREKEICEKLPKGGVEDWTGVVHRVGKNNMDTQESAHISIEIYGKKSYIFFKTAGINLTTLHGSVADAGAAVRLGFDPKTTIVKGTPLYNQLMALEEGSRVRFSGQLIKDSIEGSCFYETSLSMNGKLRYPDYVVKLSKIEKLD